MEMGYANLAKALAVAAVLTLIVVVVVMPYTDDLMDGPDRAVMEENHSACSMSEAADGYSMTVALNDVTLSGVPSASYEIGGEAVTLTGGQALCWLTDAGAVLATSSGLTTPFDPEGAPEGTEVTMEAGTLTSGEESSAYTFMIAPDDNGDMGLYLEPFGITSLSSLYVAAGQHIGAGQVSQVLPLSESDTGAFTLDCEAGDGFVTVTGGAYAADGETVQATAFIAPITYFAGTEDGEPDAAARIISAVPIIMLVGLLAFVALSARDSI